MAIFRDLTGLTLRALQSQLVEGGIGPDDFNRIKAEFLRRGYSQAEFDALRAATYAAFDDGKPVPVINPPGSASITGPVGGPATGPPPPPPPPSGPTVKSVVDRALAGEFQQTGSDGFVNALMVTMGWTRQEALAAYDL